MEYLLFRHKVEDYKKWKSIFDAARAMRKEGGQGEGQIFHVEGSPNNLFLLFEWDSLENAHKFVQSEDLRKAMQEAGVTEPPEMYFLHGVERTPRP